jgi:hypothetical protein
MTRRARSLVVIGMIAATASGCGKKGAPLAPFVRIPAAIETISATRLGSDVYVTVTVPTTNIDTSVPIDISRIDVYGYTGRAAPTPARWASLGTVVASIPVVPPAVDADNRPLPQLPTDKGAIAGSPVTIVDPLAPEDLVQGPVFVDPRFAALPPLPDPPVPAALRRFYLAIGFSQRGRPGPPGAQAELAITSLPDPPSGLRVDYAPTGVSLTWEPSGGLLGFLLDRSLPAEPPPYDTLSLPTSLPTRLPAPAAAAPVVDASVPPGPTTYHVYRELAPDPFRLPPAARPVWSVPAPAALNPAPLTVTAITDPLDGGRTRCYTVRAQRGTVMSNASAPFCVTPVDVFPPAAPTGLAAVPSEGGISLIWEPNAEFDLGGYLVLRRDAGDATLRQLTRTPIAEARYRDIEVKTGTRYSYSVVAVDSQVPLPNVSAPSASVEETAR